MRRTFMNLAVSLIALGALTPPALAANPADFEVNVDFNIYTEAVNHWRATGAIEDEGTIKHSHSEVFKGATAAVTDTPQGAKGTFTWTFHSSFTEDPKFPGLLRRSGGWRMLSGTGEYEGISGQGNLTGTVNLITGQLHDRFVGKVTLPEN